MLRQLLCVAVLATGIWMHRELSLWLFLPSIPPQRRRGMYFLFYSATWFGEAHCVELEQLKFGLALKPDIQVDNVDLIHRQLMRI
jgi:hypothetical protein